MDLNADQSRAFNFAEFLRPSFSQEDVIRATDLTETTLQNYLTRYEKDLRLSVPPPGSGRRRMYSAADAVYLRAVRAISSFGFPPSTAVLLAHHVRSWAAAMAKDYYQAGFVTLPDRLFAFSSPFEDNAVVISAATYAEIQERMKQDGYDYEAMLVVDGARIALGASQKLWAPHQLIEMKTLEDWQKAGLEPTESWKARHPEAKDE